MNLHLVVAHYNEDLTWLNPLKTHASLQDGIVVYEKHDTIQEDCQKDNENFVHYPLENNGREADTYLKYIIRNYPYFPKHVLFTQGKIEDHVKNVPNFVDFIKKVADGEEYCGDDGFKGLNDMRGDHGWGKFQNFYDPTHYGLPLKKWWFEFYDNPPEKNEIRCNYCGIFMVKRENILFHPYEFYLKMHDDCMNDGSGIAPYVLERLWLTIFDGKTPSKKSI